MVLTLKLRRIMLCCLAALFCLLLLPRARGEAGGLYLFRIRPHLLSADREPEDESVFIGTGRNGKQFTARLEIGVEGRSQEGETRDLSRLLREHGGTLLQARWRLELREPGALTTRFLLLPEDGTLPDLSCSAAAGWNNWDLTDWMRESLSSGKALSFELHGGKKAGTNKANLDVRQSWIYVFLRLENSPKDLEEYRVTDSALLDTALSALPEGHWALTQYREVSGSLTRPLWPETGAPYYFGGHSEEKVICRQFYPQQESSYYKKDRLYLCGFDCGGFLHWVEEKAGYLPHDSLSTLLRQRSALFPAADLPLEEWNRVLLPGDLIIFDHGTLHIGMYLGTPRMFGLSEENAPELSGRLDSPLMIHCGEDPFCHDRFKAYIESQDFRLNTSPPDGGVTVSLLVSAREEAPRQRTAPWDREYGYFTVLDQPLLIFPMEDVVETAWFRPVAE